MDYLVVSSGRKRPHKMDNKGYTFIKYDDLPTDQHTFPFNLFLFNPSNKEYIEILSANTPLIDEILNRIQQMEKKGARLAVHNSQRKTFLHFLPPEEQKRVNTDNQKKVHHLEEARLKKLAELEKKMKAQGKDSGKQNEKISIADLNKIVTKSIEKNDYLEIIQKVRDEIAVFPVTISPTVSLAIKFSNQLLNEDNYTNRIVALSYLVAKVCGMSSEQELGNLVTAAFLHNIGKTQIDTNITNTPLLHLQSGQVKKLKKSAGLSHHLIRKSGIKLTRRAIETILDQNERFDGSGYPNAKTQASVEPLGLVLGVVKHLMEFSEGRINGEKTSLEQTVNNFVFRNKIDGLDFEFGQAIRDSAEHVMRNKKASKAA